MTVRGDVLFADNGSPVVEQKDVMIAVAAASAAMSGFALVLLGLLATARGSRRHVYRISIALYILLGASLLDTWASVGWLYMKAPNAVSGLELGRAPIGPNISPDTFYHWAWGGLIFTLFMALMTATFAVREAFRWEEFSAQ